MSGTLCILGTFMTMLILNSMRNVQKKKKESAEKIKIRISCKYFFL